MYDLTTFRELLVEAIGHSTKQDFANRAEIKPQQLSRYLRESNKIRPSAQTLEKIAKASGDESLYDKLLKACGYGATPASLRKDKPFDERALLNAKDIKDGMSELTKGVGVYSSLEGFIETYETLFSTEDISEVHIFEKKEHYGEKHSNAEFVACASVKFETPLAECYTWLALYFVETRGGKVIVLGAATDPKSIYEAGGMKEETYEQFSSKEYVYITRFKKGLDSREKILNAIFGGLDDDAEEFPFTYVGFGFYLKEAPKDLKGFFKRHKKALCTSDEEEVLISKAIVTDPINALEDYSNVFSIGTGYPAAIAKIMTEETGFPFVFYGADIEEFPENIPCIMIEGAIDVSGDFSDDYLAEDLVEAVRPYAKELGIKEFGEVHTQLMNHVHSENIYEV